MFDRTLQALQQRDTSSSADRRNIITTVSWVLFTSVVFSLGIRLALKLSARTDRMRFGLDDFLIGLAVLLSLGQTIAVSFASAYDLGQRYKSLTQREIIIYQKADYASSILVIASMGCARLAVCLPMTKTLRGKMFRWAALCLTTFILVWMISGAIASALNCGHPTPWGSVENVSCTNAFTIYIASTNVAMELLLMALFVAWNVRLFTRHWLSVSLTALARFSIMAAVSVQLYFGTSITASDPTYDKWAVAICTQIALGISIIACIPCLPSFVASACSENTDLESTTADRKPITFTGRLIPDMSKSSHRSTQSADSSKSSLRGKSSPPCHPLATHGLIHTSPNMDTRTFTNYPSDTAPPLPATNPCENIFNRLISVPHCRPGTSSSNLDPLGIPRTLSDVGFLPVSDWDDEVEGVESYWNEISSRPVSEYVFNRQKVISVSDERCMYDDLCKKFVPPLPSPQMLQQPPRAF